MTAKLRPIFIILMVVIVFSSKGQIAENRNFFIQPDILLGKIVPNYSNGFPKNTLYSGLIFNFGWKADGSKYWHHHYRLPKTGIAFSLANPGNNDVFGRQVNVYPYITINAARKPDRIFDFKFGIGASYFTKFYHVDTNPENWDVGSHFTWFFYAFMNKQWKLDERSDLYAGIGFMHSSNGHVQLPNYGLNSAILTCGIIRYLKEPVFMDKKFDNETTDTKWGIWSRSGIGLQERGSTTYPVGGKKYPVYSQAFGVTLTYNHFTRFRGGFTYKFYDSYYRMIKEIYPGTTEEEAKKNGKAYTFFLGTEFLLGRFGIDIEGGLHIKRYFYKIFYDYYEHESPRDYFLKKLFITRLGLNLYLFKFEQNKRFNAFLSANINANFGQADFSEMSAGMTYRFSK